MTRNGRRAAREALRVKQKNKNKFLFFLGKGVDICAVCAILFSVMRIDQEISELAQVSLEEVFEADPRARAEYEAQCDIWRDEAIAAQEEGSK